VTFLNHLPNRVALALIGGILYGLLTYCLLAFFEISGRFNLAVSGIVFLFYFGSRLLLLFSGIHTLYFSRGKDLRKFYEGTSFYSAAQWVGRFYYYHDLALFGFLILLCLVFIISLILDLLNHQPFGHTLHSLIEFLPCRIW
jgi:ABC-type uncharacterized transport system permease subunit